MTQRFENTFAKLEKLNEGAFMPFVSLCDPNFDTSLEILKTVIDSGADALELGFPFSDPSADGPVIQQSDKRALNSGANTDDFFRIIPIGHDPSPLSQKCTARCPAFPTMSAWAGAPGRLPPSAFYH